MAVAWTMGKTDSTGALESGLAKMLLVARATYCSWAYWTLLVHYVHVAEATCHFGVQCQHLMAQEALEWEAWAADAKNVCSLRKEGLAVVAKATDFAMTEPKRFV